MHLVPRGLESALESICVYFFASSVFSAALQPSRWHTLQSLRSDQPFLRQSRASWVTCKRYYVSKKTCPQRQVARRVTYKIFVSNFQLRGTKLHQSCLVYGRLKRDGHVHVHVCTHHENRSFIQSLALMRLAVIVLECYSARSRSAVVTHSSFSPVLSFTLD